MIQAWFTRDTLAAYAPENTIITVRITPTKQTWPILLNNFSNLALIKNQGLTLKTIAPYVKGELSIFVNRDFSRVLAFHGQIPEEIESLLISSGYYVQTESSTVVISENEYQITDRPTKIPFISRMYPNTFGQIISEGQEIFKLKLSESELKIDIGDIPETASLELSDKLILALSIPKGNWASLFQDHVSQQLVNYLSEYGGQVNIWQDLDKNLYTELIVNSSLAETEFISLHNQLLTLNQPNTQTKTLLDGTHTFELIHDQDIKEESLSKLGSMISIYSENLTSVTNESTTTILYKTKGLDYLGPLPFINFIQKNNLTYTNNIEAVNMLSHFVHISLDKQGRSNTICAFF